MHSMTRRAFVGALVLALSVSGASAFAHPGHDHKLMGTIASIDKTHVVMKTTDGKEHKFEIIATTKLLKGKQKGMIQELKVGMRVVVNVGDAKEPLKAKEVQYAVATTTSQR